MDGYDFLINQLSELTEYQLTASMSIILLKHSHYSINTWYSTLSARELRNVRVCPAWVIILHYCIVYHKSTKETCYLQSGYTIYIDKHD